MPSIRTGARLALAFAGLLAACEDDGKGPAPDGAVPAADAGADSAVAVADARVDAQIPGDAQAPSDAANDARAQAPDAAGPKLMDCADHPTLLPMPPSGLPCDLVPPGFAR